MAYIWIIILSYSIVPAVIAGIVLYRKTDKRFKPIIYLMWLGLINEIISTVVIAKGWGNALNCNVYILAESLLLCWQFKRWGLFEKRRGLLIVMILFAVVIWLWEYFIYSNLYVFGSYFRIFNALLVIVMSSIMASRLIHSYNGHLYKHAIFIFCAGFIFYYAVTLLVEIFMLYGELGTVAFRHLVFSCSAFINCFVNLIYFIAILCIPRRAHYIRE